MKKVLVIKTMIIALCLGAIMNKSYAQPPNDADPAITSMSFATSPITNSPLHPPYTTTLTVFFTNAGFTTAIAAGTVGLNISLPTSGEYVANPQSIASMSGTFLSKFNWTYNSTTKNFFGVSNQAIAPGAGGTIVVSVKGVIGTTGRISVANIQRLQPSAYPNENVNNNNLTASLGVIEFLPVLLLDFTATKQSKTVQLNWKTSSEQNSKYFDVEFSRDGTQWQPIGRVNAAGNSSTVKAYSLIHTAPVNGINYYRLKQVDMDANYSYSGIRTVNFNTTADLIIMPNPVVDKVYITANGGGSLQSVTLFTTEGKQLQQINNYVIGNSIDMGNYPVGTYMIKIIDKQYLTVVKKIIKQ